MTYEGEIPKSLIFMHHNPLILNVPVINEKLRLFVRLLRCRNSYIACYAACFYALNTNKKCTSYLISIP